MDGAKLGIIETLGSIEGTEEGTKEVLGGEEGSAETVGTKLGCKQKKATMKVEYIVKQEDTMRRWTKKNVVDNLQKYLCWEQPILMD